MLLRGPSSCVGRRRTTATICMGPRVGLRWYKTNWMIELPPQERRKASAYEPRTACPSFNGASLCLSDSATVCLTLPNCRVMSTWSKISDPSCWAVDDCTGQSTLPKLRRRRRRTSIGWASVLRWQPYFSSILCKLIVHSSYVVAVQRRWDRGHKTRKPPRTSARAVLPRVGDALVTRAFESSWIRGCHRHLIDTGNNNQERDTAKVAFAAR